MDHLTSENPVCGDESLSRENQAQSAIIRVLIVIVFCWCGLYAAFFIHAGIRLVQYPYDVDNSEAYLLYQGIRLSEGKFLYPPLSEYPYLVDNYPPVYPLLIATGFHFLEPNFHWPRLLSFISICLTALLLGYWTYMRHKEWLPAVLTILVFLSFYHVYNWGALARVDMVGILFSLTGLIIFRRFNSWTLSLPFFLLALFTRQTLFAAPLAVFFFLLTRNKKQAYLFIGTLAAIGILIVSAMIALTNGTAYNHLIRYNANLYRLSDLWVYTHHWLTTYTVWGAIPLVILLKEWNKNIGLAQISSPSETTLEDNPGTKGKPKTALEASCTSTLLFWYTLFAIAEATLCGKIGSAPNYLLSLVAATAAGTGTIYYSFKKLAEQKTFSYATLPFLFFLVATIFQLGETLHWPLNRVLWSPIPSREQEAIATLVKNEMRRTEGDILSDRAGIPLMAGHPPVYQPFICTQLSLQGKWDQTLLLDKVKAKQFPRILLYFDLFSPNWDRERFTPEIIDVMRENYMLKKRYGQAERQAFLFLYEAR